MQEHVRQEREEPDQHRKGDGNRGELDPGCLGIELRRLEGEEQQHGGRREEGNDVAKEVAEEAVLEVDVPGFRVGELEGAAEADLEEREVRERKEGGAELLRVGVGQHLAEEVRRGAVQVEALHHPVGERARILLGEGAHRDRRRDEREQHVRGEQECIQALVRRAVAAEPADRSALVSRLVLAVDPVHAASVVRVAAVPGRGRLAYHTAVRPVVPAAGSGLRHVSASFFACSNSASVIAPFSFRSRATRSPRRSSAPAARAPLGLVACARHLAGGCGHPRAERVLGRLEAGVGNSSSVCLRST